jgi:hypothetical protein
MDYAVSGPMDYVVPEDPTTWDDPDDANFVWPEESTDDGVTTTYTE